MLMRPRALTRVEVIAIGVCLLLLCGCLFGILLPAVRSGPKGDRYAVCLSNLGGLGKAMWQYAGESARDDAIPIHPKMVMPRTGPLEWRVFDAYAWGGGEHNQPFLTGPVSGYQLGESSTPGAVALPEYAHRHRPLTWFMCGGNLDRAAKKLDWFRCPSDRGLTHVSDVSDAPRAADIRSTFSVLGNSYRANLNPLAVRMGDAEQPLDRQFSLGPWGMRLSTIADASRTVWLAEAQFFAMLEQRGRADSKKLPDMVGWHKQAWRNNVLFVDGSARIVTVAPLRTQDASDKALFSADWLRPSGDNFRLDTYPVGGARIFGDWSDYIAQAAGRWPFAEMQDNLGQP